MYAMFVCNVCMQCMYGMHVRNVCMHVCMQWFAMQCYVMAMSMSVSVSLSVSLSLSMSCHVMSCHVCIYIYIHISIPRYELYMHQALPPPPSPPHGMGPIHWPHMTSSPSSPCGVVGVWHSPPPPCDFFLFTCLHNAVMHVDMYT